LIILSPVLEYVYPLIIEGLVTDVILGRLISSGIVIVRTSPDAN